uniref:NADH-quinone oxidoreductase subunit J n=1 Tax=Flocculibacter collagenilyticus TaxID=2744479 RepID=UPI0018F4B084|nr:NADH-quinone oxidoreductase subunit J [Flocculibacter collagenilyticus]
MQILFYLTATIAIFSSVMVITRANAIHAMLYLITMLLALAFAFYLLGAPFAAALEVIVYAGAIMVLFVFAVMMFNFTKEDIEHEQQSIHAASWFGPAILASIILFELVYVISSSQTNIALTRHLIDAKMVGIALFGPYVLAVEIASFVLLAGLVGAYHLAKPVQVNTVTNMEENAIKKEQSSQPPTAIHADNNQQKSATKKFANN